MCNVNEAPLRGVTGRKVVVEDIQNLRHIARENKEHSIGTSIKCVGNLVKHTDTN